MLVYTFILKKSLAMSCLKGYTIDQQDFDEIAEYFHNLFKITLLGDSKVGKTSILAAVLGKSFNDIYIPTIGVDFGVKSITVPSAGIVKLQIWDTAGDEKFRSVIDSYTRGNAIILVFDVTNEESFRNIQYWVDFGSVQSRLDKTVLIGNKCDQVSNRVVSASQAIDLANKLGIGTYLDVSSKNNVRIDDTFAAVVQLMWSR